MGKDKFLAAVADYYLTAANVDLSELCLVFPNKRAALFFKDYFEKQAKGTVIIPETMTIGAFNETFSSKPIADHIELMCMLYSAYSRVLARRGQQPKDFDRFAFWGNMMLTDFDDIDAEMVDAKSLFENIVNINEINSYYLTDEQLEVISSIWGEQAASAYQTKSERLWQHIPDENNEKTSDRALKLWQLLEPIYTEFHKILEEKQLVYPGLLSREITHNVTKIDLNELPFKRIGFVGFNRVNLSLAKLMDYFKANNMADFFWDILDADLKFCEKAGSQIASLNKHFKMPAGYIHPDYNFDDCDIRVYAVPSNTLQAKSAGNIIENWQELIDVKRPDNTAIILPDPSLLSPMLSSLPSTLECVNITMGLSYKETPFAAMLRSVIFMHSYCKYIKDRPYYHYEAINTLISHPDLKAISHKACLAIKSHIDANHEFYVHADVLKNIIKECASGEDADAKDVAGAEAMMSIFDDVDDDRDIAKVKKYIETLVDNLITALKMPCNDICNNAFELDVLTAYQEAIEHVFDCFERYKIVKVSQGSIFSMLERLLATSTLNMIGTPLSGLQIMGVLETRAIDFENVILMSMNESVYPRRNHQHSLIPQILRRAYYLPASDDMEQEYSYYFFRLFSRSKRVICLYDSRVNGAGNGAMSRYLLQMKHLNSEKEIYFGACNLLAANNEPRKITIEKNHKVMAELQAFKSKGDDALRLSASALKKYRSCKLEFYLQYVKRVRDDDEPLAYIDSATYGSVMHKVLQELFEKYTEKNGPVIDKIALTEMRGSDGYVLGLVKRYLNEFYHKGKYTDVDKMPAESIILAEIMAEFIEGVLHKESISDALPFEFCEAENGITFEWQVSDKHKVNFRFDVDRHDKLNEKLHRFIDYKTGSDKPNFKSIEELFSPKDSESNDACFQLLTYAAAYSAYKKPDFDIQLSLYQLMKAVDTTSAFYKNGDWVRMYDRDKKVDINPIIWKNSGKIPEWQEEFNKRLADFIDEIFDEKIPFSQTDEIENCKYCKFAPMCARIIQDKEL